MSAMELRSGLDLPVAAKPGLVAKLKFGAVEKFAGEPAPPTFSVGSESGCTDAVSPGEACVCRKSCKIDFVADTDDVEESKPQSRQSRSICEVADVSWLLLEKLPESAETWFLRPASKLAILSTRSAGIVAAEDSVAAAGAIATLGVENCGFKRQNSSNESLWTGGGSWS
jgi:hypothetical protein